MFDLEKANKHGDNHQCIDQCIGSMVDPNRHTLVIILKIHLNFRAKNKECKKFLHPINKTKVEK